MHVREPRDFDGVRSKRQIRRKWRVAQRASFGVLILLIITSLVSYGLYLRPLPSVAAHQSLPALPVSQPALTWPAQGQSALGMPGQGVLAVNGPQTPLPTASVAKVMLAMMVLKKYPLQAGQTGPTLVISDDDVRIYNQYVAVGGSVVQVNGGERLSEYQALQAALLPSANNIADTLAIWAYGSLTSYHEAANQLAQTLGMAQTTFAGDASGLDPKTVSTAHDLVLLGEAVLAQPVIKEIVGQKSAQLPIVGTVTNVNFLLGRQGIIGIKTGNSDQAGGCYLFAANHELASGQSIIAVGAIVGSPSLTQAMAQTLPLLDSFYKGFAPQTVISKGTVVGRYDTPWGERVKIVVAKDATVVGWLGSKPRVSTKLGKLTAPQPAHTAIGSVTVQTTYATTTVQAVTATAAAAPTWHWRILRR